MNKYLIISDIHLGDKDSKPEILLKVLKNYKAKTIVIAGDLFDHHNLKRLKKNHWKVLSQLRKLSKKCKIIYLIGNHCFLNSEFMSILLGFDCRDELVIELKDKKILIVHGDIFDIYFTKYRWISNLFIKLYYLARKTIIGEAFFNIFKHHTKNFIEKSGKIKHNAIKYINENGYDKVIYGHSHIPDQDEKCVNTGSFCEEKCSFVIIDTKNNIDLIQI
jgi:UDP-2,3-diacylglucosamine pyrophosphatase LpxH